MTHGRHIAKRQCVVVPPTFIAHVRRTLCALQARSALVRMPTCSLYIFAARALKVRQVCVGCSLHLSRRTYSEYPASVSRGSGVGPARSARVWRPSGVCTHASSSAHSFEHAQKVRRTQRMTTNRYRRPSVLDERATNADAHPAKDSALAKMNDFFFLRWPCVV